MSIFIVHALIHFQNLRAVGLIGAAVAFSYLLRLGEPLRGRVFSTVTDRITFVLVMSYLAVREVATYDKFPILMVCGTAFIVLKEFAALYHSIRFLREHGEYMVPSSTRRASAFLSVMAAVLYSLQLYPYNNLTMIAFIMIGIADLAGLGWNEYKRRRGLKDMNLATRITLSRLVMSPAFMVVYFYDRNPSFEDNLLILQVIAILFAIAFVATDGLDGYFARKRNEVTKFGKYLDPFSDKICTLTMFLCFVASNYVPVWMVALIYYREASVSVIRTLAAAENVVIPARKSGKWKTALQGVAIISILLLATIVSQVSQSSVPAVNPDLFGTLLAVWSFVPFTLMALVTLATVISGFDYVLASRNILDKYFK